ncbi:MAG: carboxymuconolactone decarboxylase family protein [Chloroflexota bacterium]
MARLSYVTHPSSTPSEAARLLLEYRRGEVLNLDRTLLHSPPIAGAWPTFSGAIRRESVLDGQIRELAILRVGHLNRSVYEFEHHVPAALREGMSQEKVNAITRGPDDPLFDDRERAVLRYTDHVTRDVQVPDAAFQAVRPYFDERGMVELTALIAFYNMVTRILVPLQVDMEEGGH